MALGFPGAEGRKVGRKDLIWCCLGIRIIALLPGEFPTQGQWLRHKGEAPGVVGELWGICEGAVCPAGS